MLSVQLPLTLPADLSTQDPVGRLVCRSCFQSSFLCCLIKHLHVGAGRGLVVVVVPAFYLHALRGWVSDLP
jgi:hypothetical protein